MRTNLDVAADAITEELQANAQAVTFDDGEGFGFDVGEDVVASWLAPVACRAIHPALADLTPDDVAAIFTFFRQRSWAAAYCGEHVREVLSR